MTNPGTSPFLSYDQSACKLVEAGKGQVKDEKFVEEPGVLVLSTAEGVREKTIHLCANLNLYTEQEPERLLAEFIARVTYLSFPREADSNGRSSRALHERLESLEHSSPYRAASIKPNVLVAGMAVEGMFEFIASRFNAGRSSSSRAEAMTQPLHRTPGNTYFRESLQEYLRSQIQAHRAWSTGLNEQAAGFDRKGLRKRARQELTNMPILGTKAGYAVFAETPEFWYRKLCKRMADLEGAELEMRLVAARIYLALRRNYTKEFQAQSNTQAEMRTVLGTNNQATIAPHITLASQLLKQGTNPSILSAYNAFPEHEFEGYDEGVLLLAMLLLKETQS